jgi:hypothetical protein
LALVKKGDAMKSHVWRVLFACGVCLLVGAQAPPAANQNSLLKEYAGKLKYSASSFWPGWPVEQAFDGNPKTSWFTERGDAAAKGREPWIKVEFPMDVTIKRVTLLSNREPPWEVGYTILVGRVELLDSVGKVLYKQDDELGGERADMEIRPRKPIEGVRSIRFSSLRDEGDKNPYDDIAIGEILVE